MAVLDHVNHTLASARHQADRLVPPQTRQKAYDVVQDFAYQRPLLFSFLLAQTFFALLPLALFASFTVGVVAAAAAAAVLFILFWVGLAALALAAALSVTFGLAVLAWAWGAGAYIVVNFVYGVVFSSSAAAAGERQDASSGKKWEGKGDVAVKKEEGEVRNGEGRREEKKGGRGQVNGTGEGKGQ